MHLLRRKRSPRNESPSPAINPTSGSALSQSDKDFLIMRLHLGSHTDTHPVFEASGLRERAGVGEMFCNEILGLPQAEVMDVTSVIQASLWNYITHLPCVVHRGLLSRCWSLQAEAEALIDHNPRDPTYPAASDTPPSDTNLPGVPTKFMEQGTNQRAIPGADEAFGITTISTDFLIMPSSKASALDQPLDGGSSFTGRVTCSVPLEDVNGRELVAVGGAEGVWIGLREDPRSLRQVLRLKNVAQCAMLEEFGMFLVLADKYLFAYHIKSLITTGSPSSEPQCEPQRLNTNQDVQFFSVGRLNDRTLIIYMKKKGRDSVFHVLEPVPDNFAKKSPNLSSSLFGAQKSEWFRDYKDFFLPSEAYDLIFLKSKVAILCATGFEIMDLHEFHTVTIPLQGDPRDRALAKRCRSGRPMGMFRSAENEYLLCYDKFGLYVDSHGDVTNRKVNVIEWKGTAQQVAFFAPYVIIFDSRFVEVRHIAQGNLVQMIEGTDIQCTCDGRNYLFQPPPPTYPRRSSPTGGDENAKTGEVPIHGVITSSAAIRGPVVQHVFALTLI